MTIDNGCMASFFFLIFFYRYHLSFDDKEAEDDDSEVELDESCRPQFSDINKASGFLDKELEASGFTRKDQVDMEKVQSLCQIFFNMFFSTSFGSIICFFKWYNSLHNYYLWTYLYISDQRFTYSLNISFDFGLLNMKKVQPLVFFLSSFYKMSRYSVVQFVFVPKSVI